MATDFGFLVGAAVFAAVILFLLGIRDVKARSSWLEARLRSHQEAGREEGWMSSLQKKAAQAGLDIPASHIAIAALVGALGGAVAVLALTGKPLLGLFGLLAGIYAPRAWVERRIRGRALLFEEQLEIILGQMAASLRAGQSVQQAIEQAALSSVPPAREVLGKIVHNLRSGDNTMTAIEKAGQSIKSRDLEVIAAATGLHMQVGGDLALVYDQIADGIRDRRAFRAQLGSITSEGRLTANILALLPFVAVGGMRVLQPDYMAPLFNTTTGLVLLFAASGLILVGWLVIKKIIEIEY
ncbi:secretion system protein [Moorella sp. E308F]|uniref:type II secretion system F family protein n=1 Tax=Moorella sp. E308F TaxID=2572682 RepID=UPI0010FFB34D|nr:type II secretion system F family protein [Moorella sp. E308F]GEA14797.1 secretion system protein [Moorella sp. E308F]